MQGASSGTCEITSEATPWGCEVAVRGELDLAGVPDLRRCLAAAAEGGSRRLLLDFRNVSFIDSISLAAIVAARRRMGEDGRIAVVTEHPYVLLILEAGGLDSVIDVFPTRDEAQECLLR